MIIPYLVNPLIYDNKPKSIYNFLEKEHNNRYKDFENQFNNKNVKDRISFINDHNIEIDNEIKQI